jgi:MarR family transcriptional regulator, transcriptional regulator for hemolysin
MASAPIGLELSRTARVVSQAFDRAMADAGGSVPTWQVLLLIRSKQWGRQSEMAEAMGISGATLTHHLGALERKGLVRRWREDSNRRVQRVELTDAGVEMFDRLRTVAVAHDERLNSQLSAEDREVLSELLAKLRSGIGAATTGSSAAPRPERVPG